MFLIKCYYEQCCNEYTYTSMCQHVYVQVYLLNNSKNRIAGSIDIYFFNFDRFYQIMLWRGWTHLYFQQKMMSSSFPLFSYNHVLLKFFYLCQSGILKLVISFYEWGWGSWPICIKLICISFSIINVLISFAHSLLDYCYFARMHICVHM